MKLLLASELATLVRKIVLAGCGFLFIAGFVSKIVLDAYFLDNRPREVQPAEGRVYAKYIKLSYGATVYLTDKEKMLSDWLSLSLGIVAIGIALNAGLLLLAPDKQSKSNVSVGPKRRNPD